MKSLYWDGQGFCLYYKVLERGRFPWPNAQDGAMRLTSAQLAMLWEGIDWRRPDWVLRLPGWGDFIAVMTLFIWPFDLTFGSQAHVKAC